VAQSKLNKGRTIAEGSVLEPTRDLHGGSSYKAVFSSFSPELLSAYKQIGGLEEVSTVEGNIVRMLLSKDYDTRPTVARTSH
jgi:hypothetical protein